MVSINNEEFVWEQKYRPKTLDECIIPSDIKKKLKDFVSKGDIPNLFMYGTAGVGKTTVARAILNDIDADYMFINASKNRNIDTVRNQIAEYASSISFNGKRKYVILDEIDGFTPAAQDALKAFIEDVSSNCGFIFTANHSNKVIEPLHSRFLGIPFYVNVDDRPALMKASIIRILEILKNENIPIDDSVKKVVATLVKNKFPDLRNVLITIQGYSSSGTVDTGILTVNASVNYSDLIEHLKTKNFKEMRLWVSLNQDRDFHLMLGELYKQLSIKVMPASTPELGLILNKYDYQNAFVGNKELNIVAMMTELMSELNFL